MHAGRVLVSDAPDALVAKRGVNTLEEAFISYLEEAAAEKAVSRTTQATETAAVSPPSAHIPQSPVSSAGTALVCAACSAILYAAITCDSLKSET